jgi:DNA-binding NtrC family response regulator
MNESPMSEPETAGQAPIGSDSTEPRKKSATVAQNEARSEAPPTGNITLRRIRAEAEICAISRVLEQTGWNRKRAAQLLSISYRGLLEKIRRHNIKTTETGSQLTSLARTAKAE